MSSQGQFDALVVAQEIIRARKLAGQLRIFAHGQSQPSADVVSTTNVGTPQTMMTWNWTEPTDGLYVITATGSLIMGQSASGVIDFGIELAGADAQPATHGITLTTARVLREMMTYTWVDHIVDGGTGVTLLIKATNTQAGTLQSVNPAMQAVAVRLPDE